MNHRFWIAAMLRASIRRNVQRDLAGVWLKGQWPTGGAVLAPNHHSWWDGYVLAELAWAGGQDFKIMMTPRQLGRFPFLQLVGAVDTAALRPLVRSARAGAWVVIFPEGAIQSAGPIAEWHGGAGWLARAAGVPLIPVALRVVVRGAQWPEAFVRVGRPCAPAALAEHLEALRQELDNDLRQADPDFPPAGYLRAVQGRSSVHDRVSLPARLLTRLSGFKERH